jgi:hypothetical protein
MPLLLAGCHLLSRSRRLFSFQCTTGFPGAATFCSIMPFLLLASCLLAGCCVDTSTSRTIESASLPSLVLPSLSPPLSMPQPLSGSSNVQHTLPAVGSCSPTPPPALLHLVCPNCLSPCLLQCRRLLWCLKTAQSTHSHWQNSKRVLQMVLGGQCASPIRDGGSGSLSEMRLDDIC